MNAPLEHTAAIQTLSVPTQLVHITVVVNQDTLVTEHLVKVRNVIFHYFLIDYMSLTLHQSSQYHEQIVAVPIHTSTDLLSMSYIFSLFLSLLKYRFFFG